MEWKRELKNENENRLGLVNSYKLYFNIIQVNIKQHYECIDHHFVQYSQQETLSAKTYFLYLDLGVESTRMKVEVSQYHDK